MTIRKTLLILGVIVVLSLLLGAWAYPRLPEQVATHWDEHGQVNGYSSRLTQVLLLPLMVAGLGLFLIFIPSIDPLKANIQTFRGDYNGFVVVFALFMAYLHVVTTFINLGWQVNLNQLLMPAMGLFIFYTGVLISKARRNYLIGIRTPWTLSNDVVWDKTHRLGGLLFKLAGLLALPGIILPNLSVWLLLVPLMAASLITVVYSYFAFQRETRSS